jgi:hypothetical protein
MNRGLRLDVVQGDAPVILVFEFRRDFTVDDFLKKRFGHGRWVKKNGETRSAQPLSRGSDAGFSVDLSQ